MKHFVTFILILFSISGYAWEFMYKKDGIKVFRKNIEGSPIVGFRGETIIYNQPEKVLGILMDNIYRTEWVDRLEKSEILERVSDREYIVYQIFKLPWPLSKRDFVYRGKLTVDKKDNSVLVVMSSVDHPEAPETVGIRAELISSRYRIRRLGKFMTGFEVEIHSDPRGLIPSFVVNLVQKSWPYKTLMSVKRQVEKPYVKAHPLPTN
ncbi:MAG: START domain-containing protein [Bacteriovoracaceae bacterium]